MIRFSVTYALMIKDIGFGALMVSTLKISVECDTVGKQVVDQYWSKVCGMIFEISR